LNEKLVITEDCGLYTTALPPFDPSDWPKIVPAEGYVWIMTPYLDLSGEIDSIVSQQLLGKLELDLKCTIHRIELDVSVPSVEFLRLVESEFWHGIDFVYSKKQQPSGFRLSSIPRFRWPGVMDKNQIEFVFHRPSVGEPSLITSFKEKNLAAITERFQAT